MKFWEYIRGIEPAPTARIVLRYVIGGVIFNSPELGLYLAADPYIVASVAALVAAGVEWAYLRAKAYGWAT